MATGALFSAISSGTKKPKSAWGNILLTGAVAGWNAAIFPTQYNVCDNTYSRDLKKFDSLCTIPGLNSLLQTYTFCPDTAQECLGINLSDEEIAMQYCLWNVNEDNVPSSDSFKLSTFANEPPTGVQTPNHAFLSTYVGAAFGTSSGSVLGAYTYLWPAGSCEGIPDCELLEKGYYSLQSAIVKTPNALVASLVYNAETGPIAGRRGPTTIAFVDNKKAYWKTCNTAVDAASGLSVNTDCFYTVRYNSGEDFAVTKELFGSYAVAGVALAGDVTSPVVSTVPSWSTG